MNGFVLDAVKYSCKVSRSLEQFFQAQQPGGRQQLIQNQQFPLMSEPQVQLNQFQNQHQQQQHQFQQQNQQQQQFNFPLNTFQPSQAEDSFLSSQNSVAFLLDDPIDLQYSEASPSNQEKSSNFF